MSEAKRRAPSGGYAFPEKAAYREYVWEILSEGKSLDSAALLMPSLEGEEIAVAEKYGFDRSRLYVVDMNPAIVVSLKRRFAGLPTVAGAHGVTIGEASNRLAAAGVRVRAANLDFTSCASVPLAKEIGCVFDSGILAPGARVAVTMLRGREGGRVNDLVRIGGPILEEYYRQSISARLIGNAKLTAIDVARIGFVAAWSHGMALGRVGIYPSGTQTMLWATLQGREQPRARLKKHRIRDALRQLHSQALTMATLALYMACVEDQAGAAVALLDGSLSRHRHRQGDRAMSIIARVRAEVAKMAQEAA